MTTYDAFISYSHLKDKPIATALQSVIQRLGKPWYRRRAARVFRDDTSLSATPHLWPSIEIALAASRFLILLCSPESADSPWVNKEVAYWLANKGIDTLLLAVTHGELIWDGSTCDFDQRQEQILPAALRGQFRNEPRWIDLRQYRAAVGPNEPNFIELGANFAAAIRGEPKEDLLSEEIRQQRRAATLAYSGAAALAVLMVIAGWQWRSAVHERDHALSNFNLAKTAADKLVVNIAQGLRDVEGVRTETIRKILETARGTVDQLAVSAPDNLELKFSRARMLGEFGDTYLILGKLPEALDYFQQQLDLVEELAKADPGNVRWQRDVSIARESIGRTYAEQGKFDDALKILQIDLSEARRLAAADTNNAEARRDVYVPLTLIGNLYIELGKLDDAFRAYDEGLGIVKRLSDGDPNSTNLRDDVSIAYGKLADVFEAQGRLDEALEAHRNEIDVLQELASANPDNTKWQYGLAASFEARGNLLQAKGDLELARKDFQQTLKAMEGLVKADPANASWRRELSVAHERLGTISLAQKLDDEAMSHYDKSLSIFRGLAAAEPSNKGAQRDLAVLSDRVGDELLNHGNTDGAAKLYAESFAISQRLEESDPANLNWRWYHAVSYGKRASILLHQGKPDEAVESYKRALSTIEGIVNSDASNARWRFDVVVIHDNLADIYLGTGRLAEAMAELQASRAILVDLLKTSPGSSKLQNAMATLDRQIERVAQDQKQGKDDVSQQQVATNGTGKPEVTLEAKPGSIASWRLEDDNRHVIVSFSSAGPMRLDTVGVEDVLAAFGAARASMKPEIPIAFERDQARLTASNPAWYSQPETNWGGSWLSIRDPQFGWRHYVFPKDDARRLAGYLQTQVNMPVAATPEKAN
jgi:tetratricopeptide (TPR) repeat protein